MELLHRERCSITRVLSTYLSKFRKTKSPSTFPLQSPYVQEDIPPQEPSLRNSQSPQKRTPPPGSPYGSPTQRKMLHLQSTLCVSFNAPRKGSPPTGFLTEPLHRERCSISRAPFTYIQSSHKISPSEFPSHSPHRNRRYVPRTLLYLSLAVPGERTHPLQVPHQGPDGKRCLSPGPTLHTSKNSQ
jgi:hypothetical protein